MVAMISAKMQSPMAWWGSRRGFSSIRKTKINSCLEGLERSRAPKEKALGKMSAIINEVVFLNCLKTYCTFKHSFQIELYFWTYLLYTYNLIWKTFLKEYDNFIQLPFTSHWIEWRMRTKRESNVFNWLKRRNVLLRRFRFENKLLFSHKFSSMLWSKSEGLSLTTGSRLLDFRFLSSAIYFHSRLYFCNFCVGKYTPPLLTGKGMTLIISKIFAISTIRYIFYENMLFKKYWLFYQLILFHLV